MYGKNWSRSLQGEMLSYQPGWKGIGSRKAHLDLHTVVRANVCDPWLIDAEMSSCYAATVAAALLTADV